MKPKTKLDNDILKEQVKKAHPDFTPEDVEAFLIYLSLKQKRSEVYKRLADS
jgi:uncharacterized protein (DUF433 family)